MTVKTCSEKMIQIITSTTLEEPIKTLLKKSGASGYTLFDVRGDGDSGFQSGQIDGDSNILFMVILPHSMVETLMVSLESYIQRGYHLMVFSNDVDVMTPSKFG